ncbi:hypothetical protein H0E87_017815 [Populus deltoides]|uniref:ABC-2 type transporter transmembrane domain-containing protein n=1 Tax=Populus deltoides TaxID=3696 RepID=A0A8T2Y1T7_POPDE|nr:hypothetical protein H0E87_017815 [Populus deltoides]
MVVATTPTIEEKIGEDFAELYRESNQYREVEASIIHFSNPPTGSEPLKFASTYALRLAGSVFYLPLETKSCIVEKSTIQWCEAIFYCISCIAISLGILGYWFKKNVIKSHHADTFGRDSAQALFVVMGALYSSCMFLGVSNASTVQPIVSIERTVFYREKAAGMHSPLSYAMAQPPFIVTVCPFSEYSRMVDLVLPRLPYCVESAGYYHFSAR